MDRRPPGAPLGGLGVIADPDVIIGYAPDRDVPAELGLGPGARLRSGTVLYGGSLIGARLQTGHHVIIREQSTLGDDVSIWSNTVVDYGCRIGSRVKVHSNCYLAQYTMIEDDAFLAPGVSVANDLYPGDERSAAALRGPTIRRGAQIGVNATLLPCVVVGEGAIVGAGSVVTRDIPDGAVAYGNPARQRGSVRDLVPIDARPLRIRKDGSGW